jgi:hypothetical protein
MARTILTETPIVATYHHTVILVLRNEATIYKYSGNLRRGQYLDLYTKVMLAIAKEGEKFSIDEDRWIKLSADSSSTVNRRLYHKMLKFVMDCTNGADPEL